MAIRDRPPFTMWPRVHEPGHPPDPSDFANPIAAVTGHIDGDYDRLGFLVAAAI